MVKCFRSDSGTKGAAATQGGEQLAFFEASQISNIITNSSAITLPLLSKSS